MRIEKYADGNFDFNHNPFILVESMNTFFLVSFFTSHSIMIIYEASWSFVAVWMHFTNLLCMKKVFKYL